MKILKSTFILLLVTSLSLISCDNEPLTGNFADEIGGASSGSGSNADSFTAKVNGVEYIESSVATAEASGFLVISGIKSDSSVLQISMPSDVAPGSHPISGTFLGQYSIAGDPIVSTIANSGEIVITAHDETANTITGTFNFVSTTPGTTTPEYNITEGAFNLSY